MLSLKVFTGETRNERMQYAQDWRIRPDWSGVHCNTSPLRPVWLTYTICTGPKHRLSLLLARSAAAPAPDRRLQGPGLSPGTDCPTPGGKPLPGATARDVPAQTGANPTDDRHGAGASCARCCPASSD